MEYKATEKGFYLCCDGVNFEFSETKKFAKNGIFYETSVLGNAPVPKIQKGDRILLPMGEGIALISDKDYSCGSINRDKITARFCTHLATMAMVIVERAGRFLLIALEDGFDAGYVAERIDGIYQLKIVCDIEKKVRYAAFSSLAAACKAYRELKGKNVLLEEKLEETPEAKKLIGGGIFWLWNDNYNEIMYSDKEYNGECGVGADMINIAKELYDSGVKNAVFGIFFEDDSPLTESLYKRFGYIATKYDNYDDVLNPELLNLIPQNRIKFCDYTARRLKDYPNSVQVRADGKLQPAWALRGKDGNLHSQNKMCAFCIEKRMREEIPEILKKHPYYKGRFIDVYGCSLSKCFSKEHPMSLQECRDVKNKAFLFIKEQGIIAATENGFEDIIDNLVYTEGLHSPEIYRIKECGRNHANVYNDEQTEWEALYMMNPECRVPLWQLCYHENLLTFGYWGDSTAACKKFIKEKTLFACLYGCPPIYSFKVGKFKELKNDMIESYKVITELHKKTAMLPMTDFEVLTEDYKVQKSVFGENTEVVANFSETPYIYKGKEIAPKGVISIEI